MRDAVKQSPEEYLAFERTVEYRNEFIDGDIRQIPSSNRRKAQIMSSLNAELHNRTRGQPVRVYPVQMRLKIENYLVYTYADVAATIEPSEFERFIDTDTLLNPVVLFEIYSAQNERYLRGDKFHYYRSLRSLREYVLISRDTCLVERYTRQPDDTWLLTVFDNLSQTLPLATLACELPLSEIYYRIEFPSAEAATPA